MDTDTDTDPDVGHGNLNKWDMNTARTSQKLCNTNIEVE